MGGTELDSKTLPPWWILHGVHPDGPLKNEGAWRELSFSKAQMSQFGIDEEGKVLDRAKFEPAIARSGKKPAQPAQGTELDSKTLPPWWILHGVHPDGPLKNEGAWRELSFSKAQMSQFGIDEEGKVLDRAKFEAAIANSGKQLVQPAQGTELDSETWH